MDLATLLTIPPGNLAYHLVLAFSIAGALQGAVFHWRNSQFPQARRMLLGLAILLGLQSILFLTSLLAWGDILDPRAILPPLDRAASLLAIVWIAWLWVFPEPARPADTASGILSLLILIFFGLSLIAWIQSGGATSFNASLPDILWQGFALALLLISGVVLALRKPNGWGSGLGMLALLFAGHLATLLLSSAGGDFPGLLRLAQTAAFPLLLTLPQRFPAPAARPALRTVETPIVQERRRYSADPKTFHALLSLASEVQSERIGPAVARSIAQAMLADLCFLVHLTDSKDLVVSAGYDLIREEALTSAFITKVDAPLLVNAVQRGRALRLPASSASSDLKGLGQALGLANPGPLLSAPITTPGRDPTGAALLLSPYSNRLWSADDQNFLSGVSNLLLPIIERGQRLAEIEQELGQARADLRAWQEQGAASQRKYEELLARQESLNQDEERGRVQAAESAPLLAALEEARQTIARLQDENEALHKSPAAAAAGADQMERELRLTLQEVARLQNTLADSNVKILELEKRPTAAISNEQAEVIASISQELRQPMSSIIGYTDLLLGESVGILGALQHKFLERIKASTERIGSLVEDLIQITTLESGRFELKPEPIDLNLIVDNAMAYTSTQLREKNITLRLDTASAPSNFQADRESLQQIMIHLLQNAGAATLNEGTITLRMHAQQEEGQQYLLMQVSDTGGGIPAEDIPRVFARRYRADNVLIQGLGDTGVGLSIAKTLAEAQNGRIWVETEMGNGSTFSALLPIQPSASPDGE